jgi:hypothetical protein
MNKFADVLGSDIGLIKTKENFMDIDDYNKMLKFLDWISVSQPQNGQHIQEEIDKVITPEIIEIQNKYNKKIIETATELYGLEFVDDNTHMLAATIATPGAITPVHTDIIEGLNREKPKEKELVDWKNAWDGYLSCNIYINDDYSGGQVYFPDRNYEFKPKANSLVMWAGNKNFIHGVKDPIDGNRYNVYRSIKFKDFDTYKTTL